MGLLASRNLCAATSTKWIALVYLFPYESVSWKKYEGQKERSLETALGEINSLQKTISFSI